MSGSANIFRHVAEFTPPERAGFLTLDKFRHVGLQSVQLHTLTHERKRMNEQPLSQMEAKLAADFLRERGKEIKSWVALWKLRPERIAESYNVKVSQILTAIRRVAETA